MNFPVVTNNKWAEIIKIVDYAFQPIVNPFTGMTYSVEALIRNVEEAGFISIDDFFDTAYNEGTLFSLDVELRKKALRKFKKIKFHNKIKLFFNYDPRVQLMDNYIFGATENILKENNLKSGIICFELSEKYKYDPFNLFKSTFEAIKTRGFKIALDDFGAGFSNLELFYNTDPDYIKFDRFLITNIDKDTKKRSFCSHLISLAKLHGVIVIAEGIETEKEFDICKRLGFDLVQGYFIQKPVLDTKKINLINKSTIDFIEKDKRELPRDTELILNEITRPETLNEEDSFDTLFKKMHNNSRCSFFPILDVTGYPLGIIHERNIKKYIYSPFGYCLLTNRSVSKSSRMFLSKCPVVDINTPQDLILENFVNNPESDGILITRDMKYLGFLTSHSLLKIIYEKNLIFARELNPLTKLAGNILISKYIEKSLSRETKCQYYIYFDFANFKPFNDRFGFRQGDRVILIFADILKKVFFLNRFFIGHIGGDDFFIGYQSDEKSLEYLKGLTEDTIENFTNSIISMYSEEEYLNGFYVSTDREGKINEFPLLTAYASIVEVTGRNEYDGKDYQDRVALKLAEIKKIARESKNKISFYHFD